MTQCSVRISDDEADFGFHYCDHAADVVPQIGAGIAVCEAHRIDPTVWIRNYRGATVVEAR